MMLFKKVWAFGLYPGLKGVSLYNRGMISLLMFIPFLSFAYIIQDDVTVTNRSNFSLETVCRKMAPHEAPLIDVMSNSTIDCMSTKVEALDFCDKAMAQDPYLIRAWVDTEKRQIICQSGKKVLFKYLCVKLNDRKYCNGEAKQNCLGLKARIARRLELTHSAQVKNDKGIKQLNCFFEARNEGL